MGQVVNRFLPLRCERIPHVRAPLPCPLPPDAAMSGAPRLEECPAVIFLAYTVGPEAVAGGYADWLVRVDNPFFNAIPGTHHYANWRVDRVMAGAAPVWDWFDFQGLAAEDDLERVWFNPDLDGFRREWIRLWGYGRADPPEVLRHAYLMRPAKPPKLGRAGPQMALDLGQGPLPEAPEADALFCIESVLRKHFTGAGGRAEGWMRPAATGNPLGFDWMALRYGAGAATPGAAVTLETSLIAAP